MRNRIAPPSSTPFLDFVDSFLDFVDSYPLTAPATRGWAREDHAGRDPATVRCDTSAETIVYARFPGVPAGGSPRIDVPIDPGTCPGI
jgi:hypothetical protein